MTRREFVKVSLCLGVAVAEKSEAKASHWLHSFVRQPFSSNPLIPTISLGRAFRCRDLLLGICGLVRCVVQRRWTGRRTTKRSKPTSFRQLAGFQSQLGNDFRHSFKIGEKSCEGRSDPKRPKTHDPTAPSKVGTNINKGKLSDIFRGRSAGL